MPHLYYNSRVAKGCGRAPQVQECAHYPAPRAAPRCSAARFAALALVSCGGGDDQAERRGPARQGVPREINSADLKVEGEIDLKGGLAGQPGADRGERPVSHQQGQAAVGRHRAADRRRRRRPDDQRACSPPATGPSSSSRTSTTSSPRAGPQSQPRHRQAQGQAGSLRSLGLDPRTWLAEAKDKGDEEVAGVETRHVSGTLDVASLMRNLNRFVRRSASAIGGASGKSRRREPLSEADIGSSPRWSKNPGFDVYVGKQDNMIRRVSGRVEFDIPEEEQERLGGLKGGSIKFSVELRDVNGDQQIEAPPHSRPLSKLTDSLGGVRSAPWAGRRAARTQRRARGARGRSARARTRATPSSSATTPSAWTRRAPRTPRRSSSAPTCCRRRSCAGGPASDPARGRCPSAAPPRPARYRAASGRGPRRPRGPGVAPLSSIEPLLSPMARISATSASPSGDSAGTPASSARLRLDRLGARPPPRSGSAPRTPPPGGRGSRRRRAEAATASAAPRSGAAGRACSRPASTQPAGRKPRWSPRGNSCPGSTSS